MIRHLASGILISAFVISFPFTAAMSSAAPLNTGTSAAEALDSRSAAERIDNAFASLLSINADAAGVDVAAPSPKGDRPRLSVCASATWPNVDASCLSTADGSSVPRVRSITIGYQTGINTTVLLRIPEALLAQR